jgi:hypothetical protein
VLVDPDRPWRRAGALGPCLKELRDLVERRWRSVSAAIEVDALFRAGRGPQRSPALMEDGENTPKGGARLVACRR